ncbi:hypothetical protein QQS21_000408 [Conoideocrella luteorostrata]|uniref:Transferase family protein n=1 Tax=Conoideocrella luteorostrata TaxID=1105319 RepID=A0AAJ0CZS2_9HYPO|nr:hypothetical protein QQS21_000408 [Conoideocrella luteorostrata]
MSDIEVSVVEATRLGPKANGEKAVPLSLLDCTTADFAAGSAIWLYKRPQVAGADKCSLLGYHMRNSLAATLEAYPQWCGQLKIVNSTDGSIPLEGKDFPAHARRFGRIYAHYGTPKDPGVEFVWARSSTTLQSIYPENRTTEHPLWNCHSVPLQKFMPAVALANPLQPNVKDDVGELRPLLAIQVTQLGCGAFVLALKSTHPMADAAGFMYLLRDWAKVSTSFLAGEAVPSLSPLFEPSLLDNQAAGDINASQPDQALIEKAKSLPMHRYDWWASAPTCPWPFQIPAPFATQEIEPVGKVMPWSEWNLATPVSNYIIHLTCEQVDILWERANEGVSQKLSRHDAVLAHIWSCITRARNLGGDAGPVHCDLVYGVRPSFQLSEKFLGSPIVMMNIELPGSDVAAPLGLNTVATQVRETLRKVVDPSNMAAHVHSVAYEKSPQRIWQAFLGKRHILVTTWGRTGIYDIDFGLGSSCVFAEGVVPDMDGNVLIKEAPALGKKPGQSSSSYWTDNGVDISVRICTEDMERLIKDPRLLPSGKSRSALSTKAISSKL